MKLSEKICYCRKKAGLSQEALAEQIGVSRQAISKWETGESSPEVSKLPLLAQVFHVSLDWLLSEAEPEDAPQPGYAPPTPPPPTWVDQLPGLIGTLARRYGWLAGIYLVLVGAGFALVGGLARAATARMFSFADFNGFGQSLIRNNPVTLFGTVILVIGIILMVAGVILAVFLKRRFKK